MVGIPGRGAQPLRPGPALALEQGRVGQVYTHTNSPSEPHVQLPADPVARRLQPAREAPAQKEEDAHAAHARATAAAATRADQMQGLQAGEEHVPHKRGPVGACALSPVSAVIAKGETRLEVSAFVRPGRYTMLLRCTAPACIDAPLSAAILSVYKHAERVPVDAALEGSAEAHRVVDAITSAGVDAQ